MKRKISVPQNQGINRKKKREGKEKKRKIKRKEKIKERTENKDKEKKGKEVERTSRITRSVFMITLINTIFPSFPFASVNFLFENTRAATSAAYT
jgi:uncharacterized membrane protein